jgi:hypothetical protein
MFGVYELILCLGRGLATSWSIVQGVLPIVNRSGNRKEARAHKGCRVSKKNPPFSVSLSTDILLIKIAAK